MPDTPPAGVLGRPAGPPVGTIILLVLSVVLYAAMMGSLADAPRSDAMGRGLATAFGAIFATLLMIVLAILLLIAALKGGMSPAGKAGAVILLPVATVAIWMAAEAYGSGDYSAFLIPALLPPLFALYAVRARFVVLRQKVNGLATDIVIGVAIVILAGAPIARMAFPPPRDLEAEARGAAAEKERMAREEKAQEEARARDQAAFAALGPDSPMADYLAYIHGDHARAAREGIRKVKSRQADALALLKTGKLDALSGLLEYDIDATPELCQAYGAALAQAAAKVDRKVSSNYVGIFIDLERQLANLQWLVGERCDLGAPLALLEKNVRTEADSSRMNEFADTLAGLRKPR